MFLKYINFLLSKEQEEIKINNNCSYCKGTKFVEVMRVGSMIEYETCLNCK